MRKTHIHGADFECPACKIENQQKGIKEDDMEDSFKTAMQVLPKMRSWSSEAVELFKHILRIDTLNITTYEPQKLEKLPPDFFRPILSIK